MKNQALLVNDYKVQDGGLFMEKKCSNGNLTVFVVVGEPWRFKPLRESS